MRRIIACLSLLALGAAAPALAQSRPLSVEIDHTARLNLRGAAASVVVGNPQIADVTVVDEHTLFISGRGGLSWLRGEVGAAAIARLA